MTNRVDTKINELRKRYYNAITGKESLIKMIDETEVSEQVYNSNAIENSTLTIEETEKILLKIDLDRFGDFRIAGEQVGQQAFRHRERLSFHVGIDVRNVSQISLCENRVGQRKRGEQSNHQKGNQETVSNVAKHRRSTPKK